MQASEQSYIEKECITVPYTEKECTNEGLSVSVTDKTCYRTGWLQNWSNVECTVRNNDSIAGYFTVYTGFGTGLDAGVWQGRWTALTQTGQSRTVYFYPQSSKTFDYHAELPAGNTPFICYCYATPITTKQVCSDVQKTRQQCHGVLKYRTLAAPASYRYEMRSRNVTKYREETINQVVEEAC
jgi:hypothetical protein